MTTTKPKTAEKVPVPGTRIEVAWADCFTVDSWTNVEDLMSKVIPVIQTTGYFIGVTDDQCWVLSSGLMAFDGQLQGGSSWFIPVVMIRSWESTET